MAFFSSFFRKKTKLPSVSFATTCWEKDWEIILKDPCYLKVKQIENQGFAFSEKIVIVNNVNDEKTVRFYAEEAVRKNILTGFYFAKDFSEEVLRFFQLKREDFRADSTSSDDWVYYNAIGVLTAIYVCKSDYLLYLTGDVRLEKKVDGWIEKALRRMEQKANYKVANLTWNERYDEAKKESFKEEEDFYVSKKGFSDQMFLVKREDFQKPIYGEIREDAIHFPRGDVFEKRVFSYMKNHGWERITYKKGFYVHESF